MGARFGMIAPDETTIQYLSGRPFAPNRDLWDKAVAHWRSLTTDSDARLDREARVEVSAITPQITWGTSHQDVVGGDGILTDPAGRCALPRRAKAAAARLPPGMGHSDPHARAHE